MLGPPGFPAGSFAISPGGARCLATGGKAFNDCCGGVLYIYTVKAATSEAFLYRIEGAGTVIYKINLWTVLASPGAAGGDRTRRHIRIEAADENIIYINRGGHITKIDAAEGVDLGDRVLWDEAGFNGEIGISLDGDLRQGAARIKALDGAFVWGSPGNTSRSAVGPTNKAYVAAGRFVFQYDEDGNVDWFHEFSEAFPVTLQLINGLEATKFGDVWVAYTTTSLVDGGPNIETFYRLTMLSGVDGTPVLNQPWQDGEAPDVNGTSFGVEVFPSRTACQWIYFVFAGPAIRRVKIIRDDNSEQSTTLITSAQIPQIWEPGNTGTYLYRGGSEVLKTTNILTTDIWSTPIDAAVDNVWLGARD